LSIFSICLSFKGRLCGLSCTQDPLDLLRQDLFISADDARHLFKLARQRLQIFRERSGDVISETADRHPGQRHADQRILVQPINLRVSPFDGTRDFVRDRFAFDFTADYRCFV
jgi:hypothetical protein